jgi:hypothetical protein
MTFLFIVVVLLLGACGPGPQPAVTPRPTSVPVESLATSLDELQGLWGSAKTRYLMIDGSRVMAYEAPGFLVDSSSLAFSDGIFTFSQSPGCEPLQRMATYEYYITRQDGNIIAMRAKLVGEDLCIYRRADLDGKIMYRISPRSTEPAAAEEVQAKSLSEIKGLWYNGQTAYLNFKEDGYYRIYRGFASSWGYGKYSLDGGKLKFENSLDMADCDSTAKATYKIYLLKQSEQVVGLRLKLSGADACAYRKEALQDLILTRADFE